MPDPTPDPYAVDPEVQAIRDRKHAAWLEFAATPENARLWELIAVLQDAAARAAVWIDALPADSPLHRMDAADEAWDDIQAAGRVCRMVADNLESIAPRTPALRAIFVETFVRECRPNDAADGAAADPDEPRVVEG